jgi:hypothetical protein
VREVQNPEAGEIFDRAAVLAEFSGAPNFWTEQAIESNILAKSTSYPGSRPYDPESVMNLEFKPALFKPGMETRPGPRLSESDKRYVASLYPR